MWKASPEQEPNFSLRFVHRLLHLALALPPRPDLHLKLIYSIALLLYFVIILYYRFFCKYIIFYDAEHDSFSTILDLGNFVILIVGHGIVAMDMIWNNQTTIFENLQRMRSLLRNQFKHKVNDNRIKRYCNVINLLILLRIVSICGISLYNCVATGALIVVLFNLYSELVFTLRCGEFNLQLVLVMAYYVELQEVGTEITRKINNKRSNPNVSCKLDGLRELHRLLWKTQREIEAKYAVSLTFIFWKYFLNASTIPYWISIIMRLEQNYFYLNLQTEGIIEELANIVEVCIPCWICTRWESQQRQFRSIFHGIWKNRSNEKLNTAIIRISSQLGQERSQFTIGGFLTLSHNMLGKFLFAVMTYFVIFLQFRISMLNKIQKESNGNMTASLFNSSGNY